LARTAEADPASPPQGKQRLNVVLILADDLGWSDLGCYGADLHETPHLDRLASQGVRFTDAYAASVCSPTRACLMTGRHYARLGVTVWREQSQSPPRNRRLLPPIAMSDLAHEETTLAEVFQAAGYLTAIVGKWHLGDASHYPETHGFDINIGGTHWGAPQSFFYPYRGMGQFGKEFRYVPHLEWGQPGEYLTDRLTDEALKVIDQAGQRPFFLYLAHHAPHTPIEGKPDLVARYQKKQRPALHHPNATYAAMVHSLDESVGRIVARLQERSMADRTVIVFVSDNGGYVGDFAKLRVTNNHPLRSGKGSLYEGGVRVPLIVRWPGVTAPGAACREPVYVADLYPTLLEITGLTGDASHNANLDGLSVAALLKAPESRLGREAIYFHYPHYYATTTPVSAVRAGDWKLLEYHEDSRVELYNLQDDLSESQELAAMYPERARELRDRLHAWRKVVQARMPTPNPNYRPKSN
jgi:arylsulfatase A-like enzyme